MWPFCLGSEEFPHLRSRIEAQLETTVDHIIENPCKVQIWSFDFVSFSLFLNQNYI